MNTLKVNEIYSLKLISGEEVVTKVTSASSDVLVLSNPLTVAPNAQGMGLIPSLFTAEHDKPVELNTNTIAMYALSADVIRMKYIEATTGIATSSKKIVLG
jgi:hypothetical protein